MGPRLIWKPTRWLTETAVNQQVERKSFGGPNDTVFCRRLTAALTDRALRRCDVSAAERLTIMNRSPGESMFQPALRGQHQASAFTRSNCNRCNRKTLAPAPRRKDPPIHWVSPHSEGAILRLYIEIFTIHHFPIQEPLRHRPGLCHVQQFTQDAFALCRSLYFRVCGFSGIHCYRYNFPRRNSRAVAILHGRFVSFSHVLTLPRARPIAPARPDCRELGF